MKQEILYKTSIFVLLKKGNLKLKPAIRKRGFQIETRRLYETNRISGTSSADQKLKVYLNHCITKN